MSSMSIQFHATCAELADFLSNIGHQFPLYTVLLSLSPFSVKSLDIDQIRDSVLNSCEELHQKSIVFFISSPNCKAERQMEFLDLNDGGIIFDIGRLTEYGLEQSIMSIKTDDNQAFSLAKKISLLLKKITKSGVTAFNSSTDESAIIKSFRYTKGAYELQQNGIRILPFAGGNYLKLGV